MAVAPLRLESGTDVGHYRIVRLLGRGAMGRVYLARDVRLGRLVALKLLSAELLGTPQVRRQFDIEARTMASLAHPNVVTLFDVGEHEGTPWVALEYVEGTTLARRLRDERPGRLEAVRIGIALARAIEAAHAAGVVHRDLKPSNVLLASDGRPRVLDFGIARFVEQPRDEEAPITSRVGLAVDESQYAFLGTPRYMSPEQWRHEDTSATDVWSLGVLLFEMLIGRHPYGELDAGTLALAVTSPEPVDTPPELATLPKELAEILMACLAKDPLARPPASEVRSRLEEIEGRRRPLREDESPFRGLEAFTERHAALFFGRERETAAFLDRIRDRAVLLVVGPSGAGKSSFVLAGVVPALQETGSFLMIHLRPGSKPIRALAEAIAVAATATPTARVSRTGLDAAPPAKLAELAARDFAQWSALEIERLVRASPSAVAILLGELATRCSARVALVVDQLEEVQTLEESETERALFLEILCGAAIDPGESVRVIMTLRDDFLGRLPWGANARRALAGVTLLAPPGPDSLRAIVAEPLARLGYAFDDPALLDEIVAAVHGESACLPLLQFALSLLWARRDTSRKLLLRRAYEQIGAVGGALATHADEVIARLPGEDARVAQRIFLRLVTGEGTRRVVARDALLDGLGADASAVLDRLLEARLLTSREGDPPGVEIAHESLTRVWRRLARWIEESVEEIALAVDLAEAAARWAKHGRRDDELWSGDPLRDAGKLVAQSPAMLSALAMEFVRRALARSRRQARAKQTLLVLVVGTAVLSAVAASFAAWAWRGKQVAAEAATQKSEQARAALLEERALASFSDGAFRDARAQLRSAFEVRDSIPLRNLVRRLGQEPALFQIPIPGMTYAAVVLPSERGIVTANQSGAVELYDLVTLERRSLRGPGDQVVAITLLPGGRPATTTWGGEVRVYDPAAGTSEVLAARDGDVLSIAASPAGDFVVTSRQTGLSILGVKDRSLRQHDLEGRQARALVFANEDTVIAGCSDGKARRVNLTTGAIMRTTESASGILTASIDRARSLVATGHRDGTIRLWSSDDLAPRRAFQAHEGEVRGLAFDVEGRLWSLGSDHRIVAWNAATGEARSTFPTKISPANALTFGDHGTLVASGTGGLEAWRASVSLPPSTIDPHDEPVIGLAFDREGKELVSASWDRVLAWDVATGRVAQSLRENGRGGRRVVFDRGGRALVATDERGALELFEMPAGRSQGMLGAPLSGPNSAFLDVAHDVAGVGAADGKIRLFSLSRRAIERELVGHAGNVSGVAISPDGRTIYSAGYDGTVRSWARATGKSTVLASREPRANALAMSNDGALLAIVSGDGELTILGAAKGKPITSHRFPRRLHNVAFAPDGASVVVACADANAYTFEIATGVERTVGGHHREVNIVAYSPDGKLIATGSDDGGVRVFDATTLMPLWHGAGLAAKRDEAAIFVAQSSTTRCTLAVDGALEASSASGGSPFARAKVSGATRVYAADRACLALTGADVLALDAGGSRKIAEQARALAVDGDALIARATNVEAVSLQTGARTAIAEAIGVTALARSTELLALGFDNGAVELRPRLGGPEVRLRETPAAAPITIAFGPASTVAVGYATGFVGVWHVESGRLLERARLHGAVHDLLRVSDRMLVESELGARRDFDLSALERPRCDLLKEVWASIPYVWRDGAPRAESPPEACP